MLGSLKTILAGGAIVAGAAVICPMCLPEAEGAAPAAAAVPAPTSQAAAQAALAPDTVSARLHISGMTCATCPVTARLALTKVPGVYSAKVTLEDSLGEVRYDPRRVTAARIASELTRMTGYAARILPDSGVAARRRSRG